MNDEGGGGGQYWVGGFLGGGGGGGGIWLHGLLQGEHEVHLMPESGGPVTVVSSSFLGFKPLIGVVKVVVKNRRISSFKGSKFGVVMDILRGGDERKYDLLGVEEEVLLCGLDLVLVCKM